MKTGKWLGMLLLLGAAGASGCGDDDENFAPEGCITLNMMDESHGKTLLGGSDVYINSSNNFRSGSAYIVDAGANVGFGSVPTPALLNNVARETAVIAEHMYHIYDFSSVIEFPSGNRALRIGTTYYKVRVVAPIVSGDEVTGATVCYVSDVPAPNGLPEYGTEMELSATYGASVSCTLPKDAELFYDFSDPDRFEISFSDGKLEITHVYWSDDYYGDPEIFVRSGTTFTCLVLVLRD